ncbi:MAG: sigma-70 family RNA polymerase sigma factor [Deltaproteobacteria bacterium]|nr:sigma-70 family RNA polymerase sigma factor [Deltaproteobacteria bacterium]
MTRTPTPLDPTLAFAAELPFLRGLARRLAHGSADAEADDLVHDAWLDVMHAEPEVRSHWRGFLAKVLRHRAAMNARAATRRERREHLAASTASAPQVSIESAVHLSGVLRALADALDELGPDDRALLEGRFVEGLAIDVLAERHASTAVAVRSRVHRILARLRAALDERHGGRERWALALMPAVGLTRPALPAMGVTTMVSAKVMTAGAVAVAAISTAWWLQARTPTTAAVASVPITASAPVAPLPPSAPPSVSSPSSPKRDAQRSTWSRKRDEIHARRLARAAAAPTVEAPAPTPEPDTAVPVEAVSAGDVPAPLRPLFGSLVEQLQEAFKDCVELLPAGAKGRISMKAAVISDPDVGAVVENVDVVEDSVGAKVMQECVRESIYAFDLANPAESLTRTFDFTVDLDERTMSAGTDVTLEQLEQMIADDPKLLEEHPEIAEALAQARAQEAAAAATGAPPPT